MMKRFIVLGLKILGGSWAKDPGWIAGCSNRVTASRNTGV